MTIDTQRRRELDERFGWLFEIGNRYHAEFSREDLRILQWMVNAVVLAKDYPERWSEREAGNIDRLWARYGHLWDGIIAESLEQERVERAKRSAEARQLVLI